MTPSPTFPAPPAQPARATRYPLCAALVAAGLAFAGLPAWAETPTYTYTYVGKNFNVFNTSPSLYAPTAHVTFAFVFTAPLAANLNMAGITPASWTATDTVNHFSSSTFDLNNNANSLSFRLSTNASGTISAWGLNVSHLFSMVLVDTVYASSSSLGSGYLDYGSYYLGTTLQTAKNTVGIGTWTLTVSNPVPEPATTLLWAGGLAGLVLARRCLAQGRAPARRVAGTWPRPVPRRSCCPRPTCCATPVGQKARCLPRSDNGTDADRDGERAVQGRADLVRHLTRGKPLRIGGNATVAVTVAAPVHPSVPGPGIWCWLAAVPGHGGSNTWAAWRSWHRPTRAAAAARQLRAVTRMEASNGLLWMAAEVL